MFLKSLELRNFKGFKELTLSNLPLINIIGGANSLGKTGLLEAVFLFMDQANPLAFQRYAVFRNFPSPELNSHFILDRLFRAGAEKRLTIKADTPRGAADFSIEATADSGPISYHNVPAEALLGSVTADSLTYKFTCRWGRDTTLEYKMQIQGQNSAINFIKQDQPPLPRAINLNYGVIRNDSEITSRFSKLKEVGEESWLYREIKTIGIESTEAAVLNRSGSLTLNFRVGQEYVPVQFLGSGALTLVSVLLGMHDAKGGIVLLDEFDSAIHYGKLKNVWSTIISAAERLGVQIFAATHSAESIRACISAGLEINRPDLISYHRLGRDKHGQVEVTAYGEEKLNFALSEGIEIR